MAATQRDNHAGSASTIHFPSGTVVSNGQSFTPTEAYTCEQIRFYATWRYSDPGACRVSIQETTAGLPNGSLLTDWASFSVAGAQLKTLRTVNFSTTPDLDIGTKYAIVWECPLGIVDTQELQLYGQAPSGYPNGNRVYKIVGWADSVTEDFHFALWGSDIIPLPGVPITPGPVDDASDVTLNDTTATWVSGGNTDSYNVYYGTLSGFLSLVASGVTDLELPLVTGAFSVYGKISYWRVDAVNTAGTTAGDEWAFTTLSFKPVLPEGMSLDHSGGDGGVLTGTPTGLNFITAIRKLVAAANDKIWFEDI